VPQSDPPKQAQLFSFATGRPISDSVIILESQTLLSLLANRAMVAGADPGASVSPDHNLLLTCDHIIMARRQSDQLWDEYKSLNFSLKNPDRDRLYDEWKRTERLVKSALLKLRKLSATTPAGIFAKAVVVSRTGSTAAMVAVSLANDLLASPALRQAVWPAADRPE